MFPELYDAFEPPGFELLISRDAGSGVFAHEGDALTIKVCGELLPEGTDPTDPDTETGDIERVIQTDPRFARHNYFKLPEGNQGRGLGREVLRRSVSLYDRLGLQRVSLWAIDVGCYVWAMSGFEFQRAADRARVMDVAVPFAGELGYGIEAGAIQHPWQFDDLEASTTLREIAVVREEVLAETPRIAELLDEPIRLGKALLLFSDANLGWWGELDLSHLSPGRVQLDRYTGSSS